MYDFNSAEFAWKDLEVVVMGRPIVRILEVEYNTKTEKKHIHGRGNKPVGIQTGNETTSGQLTIGQSELEAWIRKASEIKKGKKITDFSYDISVSYIQGASVVRDRIVGASITEFSKNLKQGDVEMQVKLPFVARDVLYNV